MVTSLGITLNLDISSSFFVAVGVEFGVHTNIALKNVKKVFNSSYGEASKA